MRDLLSEVVDLDEAVLHLGEYYPGGWRGYYIVAAERLDSIAQSSRFQQFITVVILVASVLVGLQVKGPAARCL